MVHLNKNVQKLFTEGSDLLRKGNDTEALLRFQAALNVAPSNAILHLHTGAALHNIERYEEAVASYQRAINFAPGLGEAHNNLGNSLMALGHFAEAAASFTKASEILASSPVPLTARATALQAIGYVTEAENDCRQALILDPSFAAAHWNLALNLLLQGRYIEGWQEYEWRWKKPDFTSPCRHTDIPPWDGSPLNGETILLHAEQGFGDAIQFVRYAPMVARRGGRVVIECHHQLVQLFQGVEDVHEVVSFGTALPHCSCQSPLLSLPRIFGTTLLTIPSKCPYLTIAAKYRAKWAARLAAFPPATRVGLVWAGKSYPDPLRSCQLSDFSPLATFHDITFFSLQIGAGSDQVFSSPSGMQLIDLTGQIHDFADTAALIEQLDLVISIDTAAAHLAGSLGKSTCTLLPFAADWRWLLERSDSPWYPTMRVFRQQHPNDWREVISQVHAFLAVWTKKSLEAAPKGSVSCCITM